MAGQELFPARAQDLVRRHPRRAQLEPLGRGQKLWRSHYQVRHAGSTWTVDVDFFDLAEYCWLYRDDALVERLESPATFVLPEGAELHASLGLYGMSRAELVRADGSTERLHPAVGTWERDRLQLRRRRPGVSAALSVVSFSVLLVALLSGLPQLYELLSGTGW